MRNLHPQFQNANTRKNRAIKTTQSLRTNECINEVVKHEGFKSTGNLVCVAALDDDYVDRMRYSETASFDYGRSEGKPSFDMMMSNGTEKPAKLNQ